jgi:hypothetical protein
MEMFSAEQHFAATDSRSVFERGWRTLAPAFSLDGVDHPSVGWASRT